jgi:CelD/BcsL family acetyltransferase involved in cellulose biosynthesis
VTFVCDTAADYNDNLYNQPAVEYLQAATAYWLSAGIRRVVLSKVPSNSITVAFAQQVADKLGLAVSVETCDYIPVRKLISSAPVEEWPGVSRLRVKKYRSSLRRLSKVADVSFRYITSASELSHHLPAMMNLHIERWASLGVESNFLDEKRCLFTRDICNESCRSGSLFVPLLLIDGAVAAYQMCFYSGNTIYDWNASFALKWGKWSPGALLQLQSIADASAKFTKYNFLIGEEPYKYYWANEKEHTVTVTLEIP